MTKAAKILVVDDNAPALRAIVRVLQKAGYDIRSAGTAEEALAAIHEQPPQLVLLDVVLPDRPGTEVLDVIKADPALESVSVVLLSSLQTEAEHQAAGLDAGADGYIARPIANRELLARVRLHLRQRELTALLRRSENRARALVDHLPDLVYVNRDDRIVYVNPAGVQMLRAGSEEDILGRSPVDFIHPNSHERVRGRIAQAREKPMFFPLVEHQLVALDGTVIDVEVLASSYHHEGHVDIQVVARDITARKQAEARRRELFALERSARETADEASRYYRALFESAPGCYLVVTPGDYSIVAVSDAFLAATRTSREQLSGRTLFEAFWGSSPERYADVARALLESLQRVEQNRHADVMPVQYYPVAGPEGSGPAEDRYWSPVNSPVFGPQGELQYIIHRTEDVTEYLRSHAEFGSPDDALGLLASRAQLMEADIMLRSREISRARQELEESQALMRMASKLGHFGAWSVDVASGAVAWSDEIYAIHEVPADSRIVLQKGIDFYAPEYRETIRSAFEACARDGTPYDLELQIITGKGRRAWVRTIAEAVRDENDAIVAVQGAFQDISDRKEAEAREHRLEGRLAAMLEQLGEGFIALDRDSRITFVNKEAERILQQPRAALLQRNMWDAFPAARGSRFEQAQSRAAGARRPATLVEYYEPLGLWADTRIYPIEDGLAIYFRDVSRERAMEQRIAQSQHLEAVGQLTGGVAHDFNNLLTIILGNAELLNERVEPHSALASLASMISSAAQRGARLTRSLLAFARRQALEPRVLDINERVDAMLPLLRGTLGEHIDIAMHPSADRATALVDPAQLESALLNLCLNARDAMPEGGSLTIEIAARELGEAYTSMQADMIPGRYVVLAVSDTGTGIAPEVLPHVFEPFFTTKEKGKGTGLGLSMAYGFIKQSGGHMNIYSETGEGTTVKAYLPCVTAGDPVAIPSPESAEITGGAESVLLVEDDELVRSYALDQLTRLGYDVAAAANGPQALEILRERGAFQLLFTDIVMPGGMNGRELAARALELHPEMKVLYTSGYTENAVVHHGRLDAGVKLLSKPYGRRELAARIRRVLDAD